MFRKSMFKQGILIFVVAQASISIQAATWQAISGSYGGDTLVFGGAYFEDGSYNGSIYEKTLFAPSDAFPGVSPDTPYSFSFINNSARSTPQVDLINEIVDFSSLTLTLWETNIVCDFRYPNCNTPLTSVVLGDLNWIPIINNGNDTYTATWSTEVIYPGNVQEMSVTFSKAVTTVPIPSSLFLFGSGIIALISIKKRNSSSLI